MEIRKLNINTIYHSSLTFFVSGHAQQGFNFFSPAAATTGVDSVVGVVVAGESDILIGIIS